MALLEGDGFSKKSYVMFDDQEPPGGRFRGRADMDTPASMHSARPVGHSHTYGYVGKIQTEGGVHVGLCLIVNQPHGILIDGFMAQ